MKSYIPIFIISTFVLFSCDTSIVSTGDEAPVAETITAQKGKALSSSSYSYTVEQIPVTSTNGASLGLGINNSGQIIGQRWENDIAQSFIYSRDDGLFFIPALFDGNNYARGINDLGQVAGYVKNQGENYRAYIWDPLVGFRVISNDEDRNYIVKAINNNGDVIGYSSKAFTSGLPVFLWQEDPGLTDITDQTVLSTGITDFSDDLIIVGRYRQNAVYNSQLTGDLNPPITEEHDFSTLQCINESGMAFGYYRSNGVYQPFKWDGEGPVELLPNSSSAADRSGNLITACNDNGEAIALNIATRQLEFYSANGARHELPASEYLNPQITGLNNSGQMSGYGNKDGERFALFFELTRPDNSDSTPPVISYENAESSLWPPNHKMVLAVSGITASDEQDEDPQLEIIVSSTEDPNGNGDGNTDPDWEVVQNPDGSYDIYLRAERSGIGTGRTYTVDITATDAAGNNSTESLVVEVAQNRSAVSSN